MTLVHVPVKFRARLAGVMTACLSGLTQGDDYANDLEKLRSKVLYNLPPRGHSLRTELECRLGLWSDGRFEELLLRAEAQSRARLEGRRAKRNGETARNKALRAKKLAAEGAYRKGVQGLTSSTAELIAEEQTHWANKLLPNSSRVERALSEGQGGGLEADAARRAALASTGFPLAKRWKEYGLLPSRLLGQVGCAPSTSKMRSFLGCVGPLRGCGPRLLSCMPLRRLGWVVHSVHVTIDRGVGLDLFAGLSCVGQGPGGAGCRPAASGTS